MAPDRPEKSAERHVVVGFHPSLRPWLRETMLGVSRYAQERGDWRISLSSLFSQMAANPMAMIDPPIHGMIAGAPPQGRAQVWAMTCPKVLIGAEEMQFGQPWVGPDFEAYGRAGAEYLLERGFRSLCLFCHAGGAAWIRLIREGFVGAAERAGVTPRVFDRGPRTIARGVWRYEDQIADLIELFAELPKPVGVLASDDQHAWRVVAAVRQTTLRCPEDVAVLGVGNDEFVCESAQPTLSSIAIDHEQIGYNAARLLDQLMRGRPAQRAQLVPPAQVVTRESTGHLAVDDADLIAAIRYINEHLQEPITVEDLAGGVMISSRTLLRKFKQHLGRAPSEQVRRMRLERAKRLLMNSSMSLAQVAVESGYGLQSALGRAIKQDTGLTPAAFRRQYGRG